MLRLRKHVLFAWIVIACSMVVVAAQQRGAGGAPYTAAQAAAGRAAYQANCATCHLANLAGQGDVPPLAGSAFVDSWGRRSTRDLVSFLQLTMPPTRPGSLTSEEYVNIVAFILEANGATAGNQSLTAAAEIAIGSVATGQTATAPAPGQAQGQRGQGQRGQGQRGAPAAPPGITIAGEVKNFVPVTDAMLRNSEAGDWLMIRRDYHASNYSPLNQITRDNVKDLRLQWIWAMNEGGTSQPAPIVHNGTIYLNNAGNVLQALDGRTGDVIWENRYGTNATAAAMRGIAIYDDKIFAATSDAHLMAFDARTGKTTWDTVIGDRSKGGHGTSSGPLVIKGKLVQGLGSCS